MMRALATPTAAVKGKVSRTGNPVPEYHPLHGWSGSPAFCLALIALISLLAYSNTFHAPFVFDDESSIIDNPVIKDLASFLSDGAGYRYNPRRFIGYLTIALNYRLGGLDVTGYHIFNLAVHIFTAWLVYSLIRLTLKTPYFQVSGLRFQVSGSTTSNLKLETLNLVPLLAALLFVTHPVQTQAVTYIVQRLASLATFFYLASLVCYIKGRLALGNSEALETQNSKLKTQNLKYLSFFALSLVSAVLALRTKEIAFTLPLAVLLWEFTFFGFSRRKLLVLLAPVALTAAVAAAGMINSGRPLGDLLSDVSEMTRDSRIISRGDYLLTQFSVIVTYIRLLFFPAGQNLDYDYPVYHTLFTPRVFLSFLLLCTILGLAVWLFYRSSERKVQSEKCKVKNENQPSHFSFFTLHFSFFIPKTGALRLIAFGILWFFITLSVESSVIPITDVIFEHRLYLPSVGAFCAVAALFAVIAQRLSARTRALAGGIVILTLATITWQRNQVWGSATGLWQDCLFKSPEKVRPYNNLANALTAQGRVDEAIEQLRIALKLNPDNANTLRNLGAAYEKKGWLDEALEQYRMALAASPDNAYTHYNLGIVYAKKGYTDLAAEQFLTAIKLDPAYADAHNNLGVAYGNKGLLDEAIDQFQHALRLNPGSADAHINLGFAYGKKGKMGEAIEEYKFALDLQPDNAEAYNNLGIVYGLQGAHDQAVEQFQKAINLRPDNPKYGYNLANAYRRKQQGQ